MIVVDTSVWVDFFADRDTPEVAYLDARLEDGDEDIAITDLIFTEILQGLRSDAAVRQVEDQLSVFAMLRLRDIADFRHAAALYRSARRRGVTIRRTGDCLIAAVCVRDQVPLLHCDKDFAHLAAVTELQLVDPLGGSRR